MKSGPRTSILRCVIDQCFQILRCLNDNTSFCEYPGQKSFPLKRKLDPDFTFMKLPSGSSHVRLDQ